MQNATFDYSLSIDGNDLDAKNAQKLTCGDCLTLVRMSDALDTYELVVETLDGKELDMLSYPDSVGLAPFLENGSIKMVSAIVTGITSTLGKTHAADKTTLRFSAVFSYDPAVFKVLQGSGGNGFLPLEDRLYSLCLYRCLDYHLPIIKQTHLNRYEFEVDLDEDTKGLFDFDFGDEDYFYMVETIFNESFTQCKMRCKIYCDSRQQELALCKKDAQQLLLLINHHRIFSGDGAIEDCEVLF